jgi:hypothetical protein
MKRDQASKFLVSSKRAVRVAAIAGGMLILLGGIGILMWPSPWRQEPVVPKNTVEQSSSTQEIKGDKNSVKEAENPDDPDEALMKESTPMVSALPDFRFDGDVKEWRGIPPTLSLVKTNRRAREGVIWVSQRDQGLLIVGDVLGNPP